MNTIQIWNQALGAIGARTVASETENTPEVIQCKLYWDTARREALRDFPWSFAQARSRLASIPLPEVYMNDWSHAYSIPFGCIKLLGVFPQGNRMGSHPFVLTGGNEGNTMILSDVPQAIADYISDVTDVSRWDELFCRILTLKLAMCLVTPLLKGNTSKLTELESLYKQVLPCAQAATASEGKRKTPPDTWLLQRAGGLHDA